MAGRRPFRGDTQVELLEQVTSYEARPLLQYDEKLPKELERICHKAMSKRASERYSSAHDMAEDVRHFLHEHAMVQTDASPETLLGDDACYTKTSGDKWMLPVGTLRPNGAGLFNMQGNVNEWCQEKAEQYDTEHEWIEDKEQSSRLRDANSRVLRGGSFNFRASQVRSAKRLSFQPDIRVSYYGFRVARTLLPVASSEGK